ncbi:MAG: type I methionyl aminopeptidase [Actinobacteria bacterium]|nr:type I methionyl aminopeptidase [Actinomycetota bacterium]MCB9412024.1 type I methionyl aminopeptidase [Actinomycetota bacterium]
MFGRRRFEVKTTDQLRHMRAAGLVVANALRAAAAATSPGATTADVDRAAARVIADAGAKPSFLGYHGYPAQVCVSVNDEVIHGIPGPRVLAVGDLVSIDCGAIVRGWHGDAAVTVACGGRTDDASARLSEVTKEALWAGIAAARVGATVGDIGHAVASTVAAAGEGYGIVDGFTGHGIGSAMHMDPDVPNVGRPGRGPRLVAGMAIAIEPMITLGGDDTDTLSDGWTVVTSTGARAAHWEHTVAITPAGPWVLTAVDGGGLADGVALASLG